ncbi:MAG: hypothetical protein Fur0022_38850 [Anaerolineales bacterium]
MSENRNSKQNNSDSNSKDPKTQIIIAIISAIAVILAAIIGANWFGDLIKPDSLPTPSPDNSGLFLQIKVTDKETAEPIANAQVEVLLPDTTLAIKTTDSSGIAIFTINATDVGALAEISINATGYATYSRNIQIEENVIAFPIPIQIEK